MQKSARVHLVLVKEALQAPLEQTTYKGDFTSEFS
jgi:hypothetical protein